MRQPTPPPQPPASVVRRGVAYVADTLVVGIVYYLITTALDAVFGPLVAVSPEGDRLVVVAVEPLRVAFTAAVILAVDAGYFAGAWALTGATPFQALSGIAVRPIQAGTPGTAEAPPRLDPGDALRRWAVMALLPLCVGLLGSSGALPLELVSAFDVGWTLGLLVTVLVDRGRRGLHDRAAGSIVVDARQDRS